jgi:2-polyprenyl-6-methoxyphenol hydroxylase-like FAD-dependent oxidoreductase
MQASHDVIISGAGPVGLFLSCELALAGCSVLLLERAPQADSPLKQAPFGIRGLSAASLEALDRRGLLERLPVPDSPFDTSRLAGHFAGIPLERAKVDTGQWPYRLPDANIASQVCEMRELESVLAQRAQALGVDIRRGTGVDGAVQDADGVGVTAGGHGLRAAWLVGCDGARSAVRKAGGFEFAGTEPAFTGYSAKVAFDGPEQLPAGRIMTPQGMFFQSQPGVLAIQDFDGGAFHDSGQPVTRAHLQAVLRRISGSAITISHVHLATTWTDRARQATRYRKGRILLAGDAAHIHSPLGGQGLNLGLGDAINLGWKLAATVKGSAPPGLLDSYEAERHPVGARVLDWSRAQVAIMRPDPQMRALNAIVRDLIGTRDGASYFAGRVSGLLTRYELGEGHPLLGRGVPGFVFDDGGSVVEALRDGLGLLLDFGADAALETMVRGHGRRIKYLAGRPRESLGLAALLVRPDGIVAWAAEGEPDRGALDAAIAQWFGTEAR